MPTQYLKVRTISVVESLEAFDAPGERTYISVESKKYFANAEYTDNCVLAVQLLYCGRGNSNSQAFVNKRLACGGIVSSKVSLIKRILIRVQERFYAVRGHV